MKEMYQTVILPKQRELNNWTTAIEKIYDHCSSKDQGNVWNGYSLSFTVESNDMYQVIWEEYVRVCV